VGLAALAVTAERSGSALTSRWTRRAAVAAHLAELTVDKLPQTPSRLQPEGSVPRLVLGAVAGAVLAHRQANPRQVVLASATIGLLGAAVGTRLGAAGRALGSRRFGRDLPGALVEDALCLAAATAATRG
jgi:uncharacterized membrane protein